MVLPNLTFDALLWGLLLVAAILDSAFGTFHGVASLFIVGGATYWAAQELSEWILRRVGWTQESLATSIALCVGGFLYFLLRNQSDLSLLGLSIGLMMGSLMLAISVLAAVNATIREGQGAAIAGWAACVLSSLLLGIGAGFLALVLGQNGLVLLPFKVAAIVGAFVLWKGREKLAPPEANPHAAQIYTPTVPAARAKNLPAPTQATRVALFPQRGTLLDRLVPLLVFGLLLMIATRGVLPKGVPSTPAVASPVVTPTPRPSNADSS